MSVAQDEAVARSLGLSYGEYKGSSELAASRRAKRTFVPFAESR